MSATMALPSMIDTNYKPTSPNLTSNRYDESDEDEVQTSENMDLSSQDVVVDRPSMLSDRPSMLPEATFVDHQNMYIDEGKEREKDELDELNTSEIYGVTKVPHKRGKRKKYQKYTPEDRIAIGKYCFEHGPAAARKAFQDRYPEMSESVTRGFRDKYKQMIGEFAVYEFEQKRQREMQNSYTNPPRGRPRKYKLKEEMKENDGESASPASSTKEESEQDSAPIDSYVPSRVMNVGDNERRSNFTLIKFSPGDEIKIGRFCSHHGVVETLHEFHKEYPGISEAVIVDFHKKYQRQKYQEKQNEISGSTAIGYASPPRSREYPMNNEPQVFVLETDHVSMATSNTALPSNVKGRADHKSLNHHSPASSTKESTISPRSTHSIRDSSRSPPQRRYEPVERVFRHRSRSPPSRASPSGGHPTPTVISSSARYSMVAPPIIHYPRPRPHSPSQYSPPHNFNGHLHRSLSENITSRDYEPVTYVKVNGFTPGYPYDRKDFAPRPANASHGRSKRFKYQKYTPEDRYNIGKLCNDIGLGATVKVYREQFPRLNESVVRTFRNKYRELLEKGNGIPVTEAIERKPSRRSISTLIESEVVSHLKELRTSHIELSEKFVLSIAQNIVATKHQKDSEHMKGILTKDWANSLLWKHKLLDNKPVVNAQGVCCERCNTKLICPNC